MRPCAGLGLVVADDVDRARLAAQREHHARSERDLARRRRRRGLRGGEPGTPIAQRAQMLGAITLGHRRGLDGFELGDLGLDRGEAARRHQIGAARQRQLELGLLMLFVALATERYAHVILLGLAPMSGVAQKGTTR